MSCEAMYREGMTPPPEPPGWTADDSTFGARLALIRQRMAWGNVREAATECGLPPESWRTWERDGVVPRRLVEIASTISERTGCDYGWLLAGRRLVGAGAGAASPRRSGTGPQAIAHYCGGAERTSDRALRPQPERRSRPPARAGATSSGRTSHIPRVPACARRSGRD